MAIGSNNVGFSFDPGPQSLPAGGQPRAPGGSQSAVQVKSFTLPNRFVPGQIAPQALLQSPGGGGQMNVDLLRRLMAMFAPSGQQPSVPSLGHQIPSQVGAFPQGTGYHTQPVPMEPQLLTPPFQTQPVPEPAGGAAPLWPTPPRIIPGDIERTGAGALPEPPTPSATPRQVPGMWRDWLTP